MNEVLEVNEPEKEKPTEQSDPIDLKAALERVMGDRVFLEKMLVQFDSSAAVYLDGIRTAIKQQDALLMAKTAHKLKGAAVTLSLVKIAETASEINRLGRESNLEAAGDAFSALETAVSEFHAYLDKRRSENTGL